MLRFSLIIFGFLIGMHNSSAQMESEKINGVSLVAINGVIDSSNVIPIKSLGANWAASIPFAFMPSHTSPQLSFDLDWQWKGERKQGVRNYVHELHSQNIKVMIKPQIWIGHGTYTGEILMDSEENWLKFEDNYTSYILAFAELAAELNVEMLCIGTELEHFAEQRSEYWKNLIKEVRAVYFGKLTYAANWDDFESVSFWNELDYIGIDAYFPIASSKKPSIQELKKGWEPHKEQMKKLSSRVDKKVLFTEYGYRSISGCAQKPWDYSEDGKQDEKEQDLALKALYEVIWTDDLYVGGFLWKWYPNHSRAGGSKDTMFTVQNKKAEKTVKGAYSR